MNSRNTLRIFTVLLVLVVFFGVAQSASADLKATAVFSILSDEAPPQYKNSVVKLELDGEPTHVIHSLGTDNDDYYYQDVVGDGDNSADLYEACQFVKNNSEIIGFGPRAGNFSKLEDCPLDADNVTGSGGDIYENHAGVLELGIPREDGGGTTATGAFAFQYSDAWTVIDCDLDGDDDFDGDDLDVDTRLAGNYPATLSPWDGSNTNNFKLLAIDETRLCTNNTCYSELVTSIFLDLDVNDNGTLDACTGTDEPGENGCEVPLSGELCFFAEIYPISWQPGDLAWAGNAQARFSAGGGDKTVNLDVLGPTAITLENLVAQSPGGISPLVWASIFILLTGISFVLLRESRQQVLIRKDE